MAENLNYMPVNFSQIPTLSGSSLVGFCYDDQISNCDKYGGLYMWEIATKICPIGWHLPNKEEFETLFDAIGGDEKNQYSALIKGGSSGFEAVHSGRIYFSGSSHRFIDLNKVSWFWTSTEKNGFPTKAIFANIAIWSLSGKININIDHKTQSFSVRCVKDR